MSHYEDSEERIRLEQHKAKSLRSGCPWATAVGSKCLPVEEAPRKHVEGKPEGARFCYLASIVSCSQFANSELEYIAERLDSLVITPTEADWVSVINSCAVAMGGQDELWAGVIAVRRKALESGKYSPESYKEPIDKDLLLDAAARHLIYYLFDDIIDKESGENHLAHIVANIIMYSYQVAHYEGNNPAHKGESVSPL